MIARSTWATALGANNAHLMGVRAWWREWGPEDWNLKIGITCSYGLGAPMFMWPICLGLPYGSGVCMAAGSMWPPCVRSLNAHIPTTGWVCLMAIGSNDSRILRICVAQENILFMWPGDLRLFTLVFSSRWASIVYKLGHSLPTPLFKWANFMCFFLTIHGIHIWHIIHNNEHKSETEPP